MKKLLIIFSFLLISNCFANTTPQQTAPNGRYVIIINPQIRADKFLLDTKTGKTWQYTVDEKNGFGYWETVFFANFDKDKKALPETVLP